MKIAITLAAGRPRVISVLESFLANAELHGHNLKNFSVYLAADTDYMDISLDAFVIPPSMSARLHRAEVISKEDRMRIGKRIEDRFHVSEELARTMFYERGYSPLRNAALFRALEDGNDIAIFFEDDELPIIPVRNNDDSINWHNLDFFTPHINAIEQGAEITRGPYMGYISPIPSDFDKNIPSEIRRALGEQ